MSYIEHVLNTVQSRLKLSDDELIHVIDSLPQCSNQKLDSIRSLHTILLDPNLDKTVLTKALTRFSLNVCLAIYAMAGYGVVNTSAREFYRFTRADLGVEKGHLVELRTLLEQKRVICYDKN